MNNWKQEKTKQLSDELWKRSEGFNCPQYQIDELILTALSEAEERGRNELLQAIRNWKLDRFTENEYQTIAHRQATTADELLAYLTEIDWSKDLTEQGKEEKRSTILSSLKELKKDE